MKRPIAHFFLIGGLLFVLQHGAGTSTRPEPSRSNATPIVVSEATIADLRRRWLAETGELPTDAELRSLIDQAVDDEILYREALALGLDRADPIVRRRLIRNMTFLAGAAGDGSWPGDDALYRDAFGLGMTEADLVVRRRLTQRMRLQLQSASMAEPTEADLTRYLERYRRDFTQPARVRLSHVFLSRRQRGSELERDAEQLLGELRSRAIDPRDASRLGDPLPVSGSLPLDSERGLAKLLGPEFARAALEAVPMTWGGPIPSSYGLHLVWVHEYVPEHPLPLAAVRHQVRAALIAERAQRSAAEAVRALRERYGIQLPRVRTSDRTTTRHEERGSENDAL